MITVGLCVRNSAETIMDAIESVADQDYSSDQLEIIIVDGDSKDETLDMARKSIAKTDIPCRIFSDEGRGLGAARQIVVDQARGRYVVYIGSDCILRRDFLRKQVEFMEKNSHVCSATPEMEYHIQKSLVANVQNLLFSVSPNASNGTIFRTEALRSVDGFDVRIKGASEDRDITLKFKRAGFKIALNPQAKFRHGREETLSDVYLRYSWYGRGDHFLDHKYSYVHDLPNYLPPLHAALGLKLSFKAYTKHRVKKSFLLPFLCIFTSTSWCIGFLKAHIEGYGHQI